MLFVQRPITVEHVRAFCGNFSEGLRVEYKANLDASVREKIAKVISSFANSQGGVLVVGIATDKGVPQPPFVGFAEPRREELPLTIENICLQNLYPPLVPNVTLVSSDEEGKVFLVVEVEASYQAPHAIENSTKVYVRTGNAGTPYDLAELDLILDLVKRRRDPLELRNTLVTRARSHSAGNTISATPWMEVSICPVYPRAELCGTAETSKFLAELQFQSSFNTVLLPYNSLRRVPDGAASVSPHKQVTIANQYFELSKYGLLFASRPFGTRPWGHAEDPQRHMVFGDLLHVLLQLTACANRFYTNRFAGDLLVSVSVASVRNQAMCFFDDAIEQGFGVDDFRCLADTVSVQNVVSTELLKSGKARILGDTLTELAWAFWQGSGDNRTERVARYIGKYIQD
jgi:hypothetical protein